MSTSIKEGPVIAQDWHDEENSACRSTDIRFTIIGLDVDPDAITKLFKLEPTTANRRGDPFVSKSGRQAVHQIGRWCVESSKLIKSTSVEKNAVALLQYLEPKKESIRKFASSETPRVVVRFKWEATDTRYGGFSIRSETMRRLCDLCHDMHFYFIGAKQGHDQAVPE